MVLGPAEGGRYRRSDHSIGYTPRVKLGKGIGPLLIEGGLHRGQRAPRVAVAQYRERRADRELAQRVLSGLQAELEFHVALVEEDR
jgi:hypothetical protein